MSNNKYKILVVEDEENINNVLTTLLESDGYRAVSAFDAKSALMLYKSHKPDLIILDLGLPDVDGMFFLKELRKNDLVPVIVLSARSEEKDKIEALDCGANDYVTKPFSTGELLARVRSSLRISSHRINGGKFPGGKFEANGLVIDYDARRIFINKEEISLSQTEYNIIAFLSQYPGKVLTYNAIIKAVWGYNDINSKKKLQVNMAHIRNKFGERPGEKNYIVNELGVGYRMCDISEDGE